MPVNARSQAAMAKPEEARQAEAIGLGVLRQIMDKLPGGK